ncbi:helix-turn-helix domain-containing protein [Lonepinella sp. MS14436]|uniref:helix-turn-helix domain-containing protein n=1 Tax=Lonepinella sp. MS14436 TaxID=3003619 RepID=UPI0036DBDD76
MKYNNIIDQQIHEHIADLYEHGLVDEKVMKEFDERCLVAEQPQTLSSNEIMKIREKEGFSQTAFAHHLNVSKNIVAAWERGTRTPKGAALKLLTLVQQKGIEAIV